MANAESTCWTIIEGAVEGRVQDREAFAQRYGPVVRTYLAARWRGTRLLQDVEDAVQDVFVDCFRAALARAEPGRPGGFRAFLYGVTRNLALMAERGAARRRDAPGPVEPDHLPADEESLAGIFDRAFALDMVRRAAALQRRRASMDGSGALRRVELLQLRFQEGLPIRDIAERWGSDPVFVHREYAKARREFRHALLEIASFHHPYDPEAAERECAELLGLFD